jgi:hypothetical protein
MIGVAGLVLGAAVVAAGLRVESRSPDALCPDARQVSEGARRRIGEIEGSGEWLAALTLVHRPDGGASDVVRLELSDPEGRMRMRRELPRAGTSCTDVGQALVLLLDSYFRSPADDAAPRPVAPIAPAAPAATIAAPPGPVPAAPKRSGPTLVVGLVGGWAGGPSSATVGAGVGIGLGARWVVGAEGAWLPERQQSVMVASDETGTVALRAATLRLYLMRRWGLTPRVDLLAGPEAFLGLDRIATEGVPRGTSNVRGAGGPGARGQLRVALSRVVAVSLIAAADYAPRGWAGQVAFDDAQQEEVFRPAQLRLFAGAEIGFVVAP